jgi:hypothetical protein
MASGKMTLLEVVQHTLERLGSDNVNSIGDTVEAGAIAHFAESSYYELLNQKDWPFLQQLIQLESLADANFPNYLRVPDDAVRIDQIKYDWTDEVDPDVGDLLVLEEVPWLSPEAFLNKVQKRNTQQGNIQVVTSMNGIKIPIFTDTKACCWTSIDDEFVIFDSYINTIESTMQGNNSQVLAKVLPTFSRTDAFIPQATANFFQLWLSDVVRASFIYFRQEVSPIDEQKARRGLAVLRRDASRTNQDDGRVKYGRPTRSVS